MAIRKVALIALVFSVAGCQLFNPPPSSDFSLGGTGNYTGTITVLRVDDAWLGTKNKEGELERGYYDIGEGLGYKGPTYVPLRLKNNVAGLDGNDRVVTDEDFIVLTLNSGFIKHFKEVGGDKAHGEIAIIASFDAGTDAREDILIYSAHGQTRGSYLGLDDWPILGPMKVNDNHLRVRVVMLELDGEENARLKSIVKFLSQAVAGKEPGLAGATSITTSVAEQLISLNRDDPILDYRFALRRTGPGQHAPDNPLLYGKYVLLLQEDRLAGTGADKGTPLSTVPVEVNRIRYNRDSGRLQRVYNYLPDLVMGCAAPEDPASPGRSEGIFNPGEGPVSHTQVFLVPPDKNQSNQIERDFDKWIAKNDCEMNHWVNSKLAIDRRREELGYTKPLLGDYEVRRNFDEALKTAMSEACRTQPVTAKVDKGEGVEESDNSIISGCQLYQIEPDSGRYAFEYPVIQYPRSYTLLAQYPLHTHLIFSIERSLGGQKTPYHEEFSAFSDYLTDRLKAADSSEFATLSRTFESTLMQYRKQESVLGRLHTLDDEEKMERVCLLWTEGLVAEENETTGELVSTMPVYNELFHVTGRWFTSSDEVSRFIREDKCTADGAGAEKCSCKDKTKTPEKPVPAEEIRILKLEDPPLTGDDVTALQEALIAKELEIDEDEKGTFGPTTDAAVRAFQEANDLQVDGQVGENTRKALGI